MPTLQLRLRDQDMLRNMVYEMTENIWGAMEEYRQKDEDINRTDYVVAHQILRDDLVKHVMGFRHCGAGERCHADLTPVMPEQSRRVEPYILLFETTDHFDLYIQEIVGLIFDALCGGNVRSYWPALKPRIEQIVRCGLGEHLFEAPACDHCPRCVPDQKFDPNPWKQTDAA